MTEVDMAKKSVLDALLTKENKAASNFSRSSASAPPQKRMRLIQVDISPKREKNAMGSTTSGNQAGGNQIDRATLVPTPPPSQLSSPLGLMRLKVMRSLVPPDPFPHRGS